MRCNEIQERFVDLLYREKGTPPAGPELEAHLRACPACRQELAGLQAVRTKLKDWQDEPSLRPVRIPRRSPMRERFRFSLGPMVRYAAYAALLLVAFLAISNAEIRWDKDGFFFRTSLIRPAGRVESAALDTYTREETRDMVQRALDESHGFTFQMIQRARDSQEQLWQNDLRYYTARLKENRGKN
jgi:anti-sigma factor RsiW